MINIKNLNYIYNKNSKNNKEALKDINLTINDHEWVSIIGHNGSGKSTLSKLLVGLLTPTSGNIFYDNLEVNEVNINEIRKKVGIVFQNPDNQFVGVNVRYDIAFGLENRLYERTKMNELINKWSKEVKMDEYLHREPNSLSGGQKQRVAIAGILALDTDIIIFDEATSMLDPEGVNDITNLIKKLKDEYHKTIITITHDLSLAKLSDKVVILKEGNIVGYDTPEVLFKNRKLLESSNLYMPYDLDIYDLVVKDEVLKNKTKLGEVLWEYHLEK